MGPLDFPVQLWRARLDVDVFHALVGDMPVEERLELVAAVGSDGADPKRELLYHVVDEVDGTRLGVPAVDLQRPNARRVIDGRVLVAAHRGTVFPLQSEELHVDLYVVAGNLLLVAVRVHGPSPDAARKAVQTVPLADPIDGCVRGLDAVVALEVPDDAQRPHVVRPPQVEDLLHDLFGRLVRVVVGTAPPALQTLVAELAVSTPPQLERRSRDPEVPACLVDVARALDVLEDSLLPMDLSLLVGHADPPGHSLN